ncbi:Crp/Fnr family transcriptional regulator [Paenibacillus sp. GSMTC-2017]|uniref:Crp/Fnr family transcriptional regulator n=1 Tax=Paenibacillus sp. GSMTC-2017 TaxID=2794350 RepID=UPI003FA6AE69
MKSGAVRLYTTTAEGKELTLDILAAGHLFGEIGSLVTDSNIYAVTLEDSVICTMEYEQFKLILRQNPEIAIAFIELMSKRVQEVEQFLEHMAYSSVRKRLLFLLYKLSEKFGEPPMGEAAAREKSEWVQLNIELTHQELASMTGNIRETITETLNVLTAEGILEKSGPRKPLLINTARLKGALEV